MNTQLKVIKADGRGEEYLHTKVIGMINHALVGADQADMMVAENLAEVVTYHLYHKQGSQTVSSSQILSMVKACLSVTGYDEAAAVLSEHCHQRDLRRRRVEVVSIDIEQPGDAEKLIGSEGQTESSGWDKSVIVEDLIGVHGLCRQISRTIASMVEERVLNMGITQVPTSLVRQLVLVEIASVLRAQRQLQTA